MMENEHAKFNFGKKPMLTKLSGFKPFDIQNEESLVLIEQVNINKANYLQNKFKNLLLETNTILISNDRVLILGILIERLFPILIKRLYIFENYFYPFLVELDNFKDTNYFEFVKLKRQLIPSFLIRPKMN